MQVSIEVPERKPRITVKQSAHTPAGLLRLDLARRRLDPSAHRFDTIRLKPCAEDFINLTRRRDYPIWKPVLSALTAYSTAVVNERITDLPRRRALQRFDLRLQTIPK